MFNKIKNEIKTEVEAMNIGNNISALRKKKGITQEELANAKSSDDKKNIMIKVTQQNGKENIIKVPFKFVKLGLNIGNMFGLSKDISDKIATLAENDMTDIVNIDTENGEHIAITLD